MNEEIADRDENSMKFDEMHTIILSLLYFKFNFYYFFSGHITGCPRSRAPFSFYKIFQILQNININLTFVLRVSYSYLENFS